MILISLCNPTQRSEAKNITDVSVEKPIAKEAHVVHKNEDGTPRFTNALIHSKSTYLRQHAHQPIQWQAWQKSVLEQAQKDHKMIFLSVGYATCHWCHVMARESFEDLEIAQLINQHWIAIKVDRQELPHIDDFYMSVLRKISGRGGWPMTLVLTPDRKPIFAATYLPPRTGFRGRREGVWETLNKLLVSFQKEAHQLQKEAEQNIKLIQKRRSWFQKNIPQDQSLVNTAQSFTYSFDQVWGGFGKSPKFPRPATLRFLLGYARRSQDDFAYHMVSHTLEKMSKGGIRDHVGGGFHRYSVDRTWHIPHFEKMLYDQSQLVMTYIEAWQVSHHEEWKDIVTQTLEYLGREMKHPLGGFYAATDADSLSNDGEEVEGFFFTWTYDELKALLPLQDAGWFYQYYAMSKRLLEGRSVLRVLQTDQRMASQLNISSAQLRQSLMNSRKILYKARQKRAKPMLDEQVISAWNGLLLSSFATSSLVFKRPQDLVHAHSIAQMILKHMRSPDGKLWRIYAQHQKLTEGGLNDYAACIAGFLDLFKATSQAKWLRVALQLQAIQDQLLWDKSTKTYRQYPKQQTKNLANMPPADGDYAMPAGVSIAAHNLLKWFDLTSDIQYENKLKQLLQSHAILLQKAGYSWPYLSHALNIYLDQRQQVIIVASNRTQAQPMLDLIRERYLPHVTTIILTEQNKEALIQTLPTLLKDKPMLAHSTTFYLCENFTCRAPSTSIKTLSKYLDELSPLQQKSPYSLYELVK